MSKAESAPNQETAVDVGGDRPCANVNVLSPERLVTGFRHYDRFDVTLSSPGGGVLPFKRELLRSGPVVGVLPVDPDRGEIVLTRQFRLGGHLAAGLGEMVEIVAGRIDEGETPEDAASRECLEEIGVEPAQLVSLFAFAPAPALTDEFMHLFLARIDAAVVPLRAGLRHEVEDIAIIRYRLAEVVDLLSGKSFHSGPTITALQWLTANQITLDRYLR
jgi:ADP-ribose pyrophosphatase